MVLVVVGGHEFVEDASQTNSWGRHRGCIFTARPDALLWSQQK